MSDLFFSADPLGEFERLQRQMASVFAGIPASLRATRSEPFPPRRHRQIPRGLRPQLGEVRHPHIWRAFALSPDFDVSGSPARCLA
ncbi:hypothetical protein PWR63_17300 [Paraburkholderia sp. A2WS-5]|uniref:hypothetical protein n=1 Tax=unclassified Paraburkholderia TaxID=2615204 RepID=UPI003B815D15